MVLVSTKKRKARNRDWVLTTTATDKKRTEIQKRGLGTDRSSNAIISSHLEEWRLGKPRPRVRKIQGRHWSLEADRVPGDGGYPGPHLHLLGRGTIGQIMGYNCRTGSAWTVELTHLVTDITADLWSRHYSQSIYWENLFNLGVDYG